MPRNLDIFSGQFCQEWSYGATKWAIEMIHETVLMTQSSPRQGPKHILNISVIIDLTPIFSSHVFCQWLQNRKLTFKVLKLESYHPSVRREKNCFQTMKFTEGTQGGDIASYISGEWVYPESPDFSKRWLEINLLRNLLTSFSILRNGNWCEIFPLSFLTLPRLWVKGKTYTEIKQNGRWTAIWHLWLETSNQKNAWLYFRLWCSWH